MRVRGHICQNTLLAGSFVAAFAPLSAAAAPCGSNVDEAGQSRCARALYEAGEFAEAAEAFELLWRQGQTAKYLYNHAMAREAAGSHAWALILLLRYLEGRGLTDAERDDAISRSARVRARLHTVDIMVAPAGAVGQGATVYLEREQAGKTEQFSVPLWSVAYGDGIRLHLDPGLWVLWIDPASHIPAYNVGGKAHLTSILVAGDTSMRLDLKPASAEQVFTMHPASELRRGVTLILRDPEGIEAERTIPVDRSTIKLTIRRGPWHYLARPRALLAETRSGEVDVGSGTLVALRWDPSPSLVAERQAQRKMRLGLSGASAGAAAIGSGLLGALAHEGSLRCYPSVTGSCESTPPVGYYENTQVKAHWRLAAWGGGFLGGAIGLGAGAALEALPPKRARIIATLASGGVVAIAGVAIHARVGREFVDTRFEAGPGGKISDGILYLETREFQGLFRAGGLTAGMAGLGIGLLLGTGSAALARHFRGRKRHANVAVGTGPVSLGLSVQGSF